MTKSSLTERDTDILKAIFEARYMTNRQVSDLLFTPSTFSWCKQRLSNLVKGKYLAERARFPNEQAIYFLGIRGRHYIAKVHPTYTQEEINRIAGVSGGNAKAPILMMNHDLTLSTLYVRARREAYGLGIKMEWRNARMLELMKLGLQPDAYLCLRCARLRAGFMEFTSVLPDAKQLAARIRAYEQYLEGRHCGDHFGVDSIYVLWLTTSLAKLQRLREAILKSEYADYFLLGLIEDARRFLSEPMWIWSGSEDKVSWMPGRSA